jgi:ATP-dependent RNA helicase DHX29
LHSVLQVSHEGGYVMMGGWIRIRASAQTAVLVKKARGALQVMLQKHIGRNRVDRSRMDAEVRSAIVTLLVDEEKERLRNF